MGQAAFCDLILPLMVTDVAPQMLVNIPDKTLG
jgi:hypothetical protein